MRPSTVSRTVLLAALALVSPGALAQGGDSLRWDPETGRDLANYLPHRDFDHTHMTLELDFPDFEHEARAICRCTLTMQPIGTPRQSIRLDAVGMTIDGVTYEGRQIGFTQRDGDLLINLPDAVPLGESVTLVFDYTLGPESMAANGEALSWSPPKKRPNGPSEEVPMLHSQGEPEYARRWFPCFDHPNERLATELVVTVADGYEVVSNGELKSKEPLDDGRVRWHWDQALPHAPYLVSLVIGKFDVVDVGGPDTARPGLPMPVYAPVGMGDKVRLSFAHTPAMVAFMEKVFDEPYPWAKYSQAIVRDFAAGAMENTSATTFFPFAAAAEPGTLDDIIVHELTHQWTGDLLTNENWAHLWLQEGWATYGEALWDEHVAEQEAIDAGKTPDEARDAARRAYLRSIRGNFRQAARAGSRTSAPDSPALTSNLYRDPNDTFSKANNPYPRGACVLHMLRERLGEDAFWAGVHLYIDRYKFSAVETDDFRKCMEEASGDSLERFFAQWVYRAGAAKADVELAWEPKSEVAEGPGVCTVTLRQVQKIDADNPAYAMVVPVYLKFDDAPGEYVYIDTEEREVIRTFELEHPPVDAVVDPYNWNILDASVTTNTAPEPAESDEHAAQSEPAVQEPVGAPAGR